MNNELREQVIKRIVKRNYYLTQSIINNDIEGINKHRLAINNLINGILNEPIKNYSTDGNN